MSPASNALNTAGRSIRLRPSNRHALAPRGLNRRAAASELSASVNTLRQVYAQANSDRSAVPTNALRVLGAGAACGADEIAHVLLMDLSSSQPTILTARLMTSATRLIGRARKDLRLLANHLLARIPELRDLCFFVDLFDGQVLQNAAWRVCAQRICGYAEAGRLRAGSNPCHPATHAQQPEFLLPQRVAQFDSPCSIGRPARSAVVSLGNLHDVKVLARIRRVRIPAGCCAPETVLVE
jgi:hypothetical protein